MIYMDNAATSGFKPYSVIEVATTVIKHLSANPSRSGHRLSEAGGEAVFRTRSILKEAFNCPALDRIVFTKNCTEALNTAIFGLLKKGDHVITTCMEHNSVLRPLSYLKVQNFIDLDVIYPQKTAYITHNSIVCYEDIRKKIRPQTKLIITNHASNVTGSATDVRDVSSKLKAERPDIIYMVDGAQSGGHVPIDMQRDNIDVLCLAGHKGLLGIMGSGVLIFNERAEILPLTHGGTGSDSFNLLQPDYYPDRLESGTLNLPAISALFEGVLHVQKNLSFIGSQLSKMTASLINELKNISGVQVYSLPNPFGLVGFSISSIPSLECAYTLSEKFGIAVRGGFHCAPLMHEYLGTKEKGLIRVSLSTQNTYNELSALISAINKLSTSSKDI